MSEANRNEQLRFVFRGQLDSECLSERGRTHAEIDRDVQDLAHRTADQLGERRTHILIMKAANDAVPRAGVRILNEFVRQAGFGKIPFVPRFDKKTAFVLKVVDIKDDESVKRCFGGPCFHKIDRSMINL